MAWKPLSDQEQLGLLDRLILALADMVNTDPPVDIITFAEHPDYLNQLLFTRQRLILKVYYKLPLDAAELADARYLLRATDKYARMYFPGIRADEVDSLSDAALQDRLLNHYAYILALIAGRRGSKSVLGAIVDCYELYRLIREPALRQKYRAIVGQEIGVANVAVEEEQGLAMFGQVKALIDNSVWFQQQLMRPLQGEIEFTGRSLFAKSLHSNSKSNRGRTYKAAFFDEFCWLSPSDSAKLWAALAPSVLTFGMDARLMILSSPAAKEGVGWDLFSGAEQGTDPTVIAFQLATWEMNDAISRDAPLIVSEYARNPIMAEIEYGAQWADSVGTYFPEAAVRAIVPSARQRDANLAMEVLGRRDVRYVAHLDLAEKKDDAALAVGYFDKKVGRVRATHLKRFSPKDPEWRNEYGELDLAKIRQYVYDNLQARGFEFALFTLDQFNSMDTIQEFRKKGINAEKMAFTPKVNMEIYTTLRALVVGGAIEWYAEPELETQLIHLVLYPRSGNNFAVAAPAGRKDDYADALAAMAHNAIMLATGGGGIIAIGHEADLPNTPQPVGTVAHLPTCTEEFCEYTCPALAAAVAARQVAATH